MDTRLYLSKQAKDNPRETLETLQKAAVEVFSESETNLTELQKKGWFKRLFELLTFSRNNEKALAKPELFTPSPGNRPNTGKILKK